jgi:GTP diphosphokinase / guanosine-3',5'-bis(diphosphate) 3'-diphosphatase
MLSKAISIVAQAFEGDHDKGGSPYILHCLTVMQMVGTHDEELACIAVMHDLIEDTEWTKEDLLKEGFSIRVAQTVHVLTHDNGVPYDDYIKVIALNEDATKVKMADLRHNSDIMRMKGLRKKDFDRLEKYHRSYMYLKDLY